MEVIIKLHRLQKTTEPKFLKDFLPSSLDFI